MVSPLESIKKLIIWLIYIYQIGISPILNHRCRFSKTCSQYGIDSIVKFGILKGVYKTCIRILKCHPLNLKYNKDYKYFEQINIQDSIRMNGQHNFIITAFLVVSFLLWQTWETDPHPQNNIHSATNIHNNLHSNSIIPPTTYHNKNPKIGHILDLNHIITVKTDVFLLKINTHGGDIEEAYLIKYLENLDSKKPFHLLKNSKECKYQINSGLVNAYLLENKNQAERLIYTNTSNQTEHILSDYDNQLELTLTHYHSNGTIYTKRYIFNRNDYSIHIYYTINNLSTNHLQIQLFGNLIQSDNISNINNDDSNFPLYSYKGAAYSTNQDKYQKYSFKDIKNKNLDIKTTGGWIAMLQKYFISAWIPIFPHNNTFYSTYSDDNNITIGFKSDVINIPANTITNLHSILWIGPKIQEKMKSISPNLNLVVDYGWLWFISQPLFNLLEFIFNYINNWGISIILITLIIRLIMYPLTKAQYTSMAKIRMLQPKLASIQEEYKNDKFQYHQKTIQLYKEEQVNPLGGCLPLLIQMPIFLALYYMLSGSVELRHAKFTLWINDLSAPDPYYILPIIMGITMFFIQKMSPTTVTDPIQKKIMTIMLIIFTVFFLWFPSGLVLYYIASNIITIAQQQIIYHGLSKKGLHN